MLSPGDYFKYRSYTSPFVRGLYGQIIDIWTGSGGEYMVDIFKDHGPSRILVYHAQIQKISEEEFLSAQVIDG
jgi:hypothetical protein